MFLYYIQIPTWWLALGFHVLSPIMLSVRCPALKNRKLNASSCDKAISSFTRGAAFSIKTCLRRSRDVGSCLTLSQPGQRRQHGVRDAQQDGCALCLKWVSVFWAQAEHCSAVQPQFTLWAGKWDVATEQYLTSCRWVVLPRWNTMAAPDTAHSHTVLPHWKSHKTWFSRDSGAVDDVF